MTLPDLLYLLRILPMAILVTGGLLVVFVTWGLGVKIKEVLNG